MTTATIDLLDLDRFQRLEHHEMFKRLRAEDPVSWHDHPGGQGVLERRPARRPRRHQPRHGDLLVRGGRREHPRPGRVGEQGGVDPRGLMMLYMDPPKHTRYRLLVNKGFTPRMIGLLEQYLKHRAILIVDNIIERGSCDFVDDLASELPLQAIAEIMGVPQEDRKLLFDWSNRMIGVDDPEYANGADDGMNASMELYMYVNELAKKRKTDPRDDIVTKLINAEVEGDRLSEIEFDMFMLLLTVAGNETTRNTTAWGMWALMENPSSTRSCATTSTRTLDRAIEEILRWATPVYHFRRTATVDTELRGKEIKQGDKVVIWHTSANRDEAGLRRSVHVRHHALAQRAHRVRRRRRALLPRRQPGPHGAAS